MAEPHELECLGKTFGSTLADSTAILYNEAQSIVIVAVFSDAVLCSFGVILYHITKTAHGKLHSFKCGAFVLVACILFKRCIYLGKNTGDT